MTLTANAADDDTIAKVEFFQGTTLLATDTTAPYTFNWAGVPAGNGLLGDTRSRRHARGRE